MGAVVVTRPAPVEQAPPMPQGCAFQVKVSNDVDGGEAYRCYTLQEYRDYLAAKRAAIDRARRDQDKWWADNWGKLLSGVLFCVIVWLVSEVGRR